MNRLLAGALCHVSEFRSSDKITTLSVVRIRLIPDISLSSALKEEHAGGGGCQDHGYRRESVWKLYISRNEKPTPFAQRTMRRFLNERAGECSDSFNAAI
jgi:hypothetical protein